MSTSQEELIAQHEATVAALEAKHQAQIQSLKDSWIMAQKQDTCVAAGSYGTIWELERRGLITTSVSPDGFVEWQAAESELLEQQEEEKQYAY